MKVIHLLRKPLSEGTVAANVLRHGTGALNIDATRVACEGGSPSQGHREGKVPLGNYNGWCVTSREGYTDARPGEAIGRWPANLVLQHLDGCRQDGVGMMAAWTCAPGCPVAALDQQSGVSHSAKGKQSYKRADTTSWKERGGSFTPGREWEAEGFGDSGGASRYFKQVKSSCR